MANSGDSGKIHRFFKRWKGRNRRADHVTRALLFICLLVVVRHFARPPGGISDTKLIISFETLGGFTNQVLDIAYVAVLASVVMPCSLVIPELSSDGTQYDGLNRITAKRLAFDELFDLNLFSSFLIGRGVQLLTRLQQIKNSCKGVCRAESSIDVCIELLAHKGMKSCAVKNIHIQAPFLHQIWSSEFLRANDEVFHGVMAHIKPSKTIEYRVEQIHSHFMLNSPTKSMCFLHARIEEDWYQHCLQWHPYKADYKYNCYVSLEEIFERVSQQELGSCDFHITYEVEQVSSAAKQLVKYLSKEAGFSIIAPSEHGKAKSNGREEKAAVEFFLALQAEKFVGNSVSTLSALIMMLRQKEDRWSAQYNRGPIPLAGFIPGFRIPWVFTLRGSDERYEDNMKIAVRSALQCTTLMPHAIVHASDTGKGRIKWIKENGVRVIFHTTRWDEHVAEILKHSSARDISSSHLYKNIEATLATYFRLDLGIIPELAQFEHILYTDTDVFFRKDVNYFTQPVLPDSIMMGFEERDVYPLNAGVFFASMKFLRETHAELISTFANSLNVNDEKYGPGDQGLLNRMYERQLEANGPLDNALNTKPYKYFHDDAVIVHFHGPKIQDYVKYARDGSCRFKDLCVRGFQNGFCNYLRELQLFLDFSELQTVRKQDIEIARHKCERSGYFGIWS